MAAFCHYWRMTPADWKALTLAETRVMTEFAEDQIDAQKRATKRRR
jgi:hypothetical protein